MDFSNFLTLKMWFSMNPGALTPLFRNVLIGLIIFFALLLIVSWRQQKKLGRDLYVKVWRSFFNFSVTGLIIGALLFFFTYEGAAFFSARFWFLIWFLIHAVWLYTIYRRLKKLPAIKKELEEKREFNKYIP
ncbi:MAG: hypothetical protein Q8Q23_02635 [bacterium]|nr:hypothetical protein [bacterium]